MTSGSQVQGTEPFRLSHVRGYLQRYLAGFAGSGNVCFRPSDPLGCLRGCVRLKIKMLAGVYRAARINFDPYTCKKKLSDDRPFDQPTT